jgi:hypothetical protein
MEENETVVELLPKKKYNVCGKCSVTYAKDRKGRIFVLDEEVYINEYHQKTNDRIFIIKGIYITEECESGWMIFLADKETGKYLKSVLNVNWLIKISK